MPGSVGALMRFVRSHATAPQSDLELLRCFTERGDHDAFGELVERYGPVILGICRRILRDSHEAEDAFQATFLLLSRKAASLRQPDRLGAWLQGVACRIAHKALRRAWRGIPLGPEYDPPMPVDAHAEAVRDLRPILDEAILALPAKYREPVVLCYLQGLTNADVARRLGCPLGTVATRLSRARNQMRARLVRRGVVLPCALLPAHVAQAAVAPLVSIELCDVTVAQIAGPAAANITQLIEGICRTMLIEKSRWLAGAFVVLSTITMGFVSYHSTASEPARPAVKEADGGKEPATEPPAPIATTNFIVECDEPRCARLVAETAERQRLQIAELWLGKELPKWTEPCKIQVKIAQERTCRGTVINFGDGKIQLSMLLGGPLDRLLADWLPREVTHTVMATHFGKPVPRWANEGIAMMSESPEEQNRHRRQALEMVANDRTFKLKGLLPRKDYPEDVLPFCAQSYSLTEFLVGRKDRATLLAFVKAGMEGDWSKAATKHYGFRNLDEMEEAWKNNLGKGAPAKSVDDLAKRASKGLPSGPGPVIGLAFVENGLIVATRPDSRAEAVSTYEVRKNNGKTYYEPVTTYQMSMMKKMSLHSVKEVRAFELDGTPIDGAVLLDRLKKETAVLLSSDAKPDPFYLQVIKPGTLILQIADLASPPMPLPAPATPAAPKLEPSSVPASHPEPLPVPRPVVPDGH